jgi:hypothetical protein
MSPDDLLELCAEFGRNPALSYDLAGSREHLETVCRLVVQQAQDLSARTEERDQLKRDERRNLDHIARAEAVAGSLHGELATVSAAVLATERDNRALQLQVAAMTNERDRLAADLDQARNAWQADILLRDAAEGRREDAETTAMLWQTIADRALQDAKRVPAEQLVVDAGLDLSRALVVEQRQHAKTRAELAKALRRLEESQQTVAHNDALHSAFSGACEAVTGYSVAEVNLQLDAELAAHPEPGPLHHARDQRDHQEDTTP